MRWDSPSGIQMFYAAMKRWAGSTFTLLIFVSGEDRIVVRISGTLKEELTFSFFQNFLINILQSFIIFIQ
jgi:hypothetical protein